MCEELVAGLVREMMESVGICKNRYGYNPTRFLQMLEQNGPIDTAISLVMAPKIHEGLSKLWEFKRLDLSIEAIICKEPYRQLFSDDVLARAKSRLQKLGYCLE
jgi:hypothetical protein